MEKQRGIKVLSVVALIVAVLGLTIAFAALSTTLNITGTGSVKGNSGESAAWNVHFVGESLSVTKTEAATNSITFGTEPSLGTLSMSVGDLNLSLPGDKVTYAFQVTNAGSANAELADFGIATPHCTGTGNNATTDADNVCNDLKYTLTYSDGTEIKLGDTLLSGVTKDLLLTIEYSKTSNTQTLPENEVSINFEVSDNNKVAAYMIYVQK